MYQYLNQLKISHRIWLMTTVSVLCLIAVSVFFIQEINDHLYEEKQIKNRQLVEAVYGTLEYFQAQEQVGKLTRQEAQEAAIGLVRGLRYESKDYFWINDMQPKMIMHPYKPELEGQDLSNIQDPSGKRLFVAFVDRVRQAGEGYVDYLWPYPGKQEPVKKVSYVKGFEPWGWILGSGLYLDDIAVANREHTQVSLLYLAAILSLLTLITIIIARSITRPLGRVADWIDDLATGHADLSKALDISGRSEISQMARGLNDFVDKMHGLINKLMKTSEALQASTNQVTSIAHQTHQSVSRQRTESDQVATAMTELQATAGEVAGNAARAAQAAQQANSMALDNRQTITASIASISKLHDNIKSTTQVISQLQQGSAQIGGIVETIQSISEQTNLLALNAAIEAARAGDQGRGFAVVADEVRELAKRTQQSTLEIEKTINQLQQGAEQAVKVAESGKSEAEKSVEQAEQMSQVLESIVEAISNIQQMNTQIATAAEEQSVVVTEINQNVVRISTIANDNAQGASDTVDAAKNMGAHLTELSEVAASFRLSEQDASFDFASARAAHLSWVGRVEAHLDGRGRIRDDELVSHHNCALGQWYDGPGLANYGNIGAMQRIAEPHAALHRTISECIELEKQGKDEAAHAKLRGLEGLSRQIVDLLNQVEREISRH